MRYDLKFNSNTGFPIVENIKTELYDLELSDESLENNYIVSMVDRFLTTFEGELFFDNNQGLDRIVLQTHLGSEAREELVFSDYITKKIELYFKDYIHDVAIMEFTKEDRAILLAIFLGIEPTESDVLGNETETKKRKLLPVTIKF